MLKRYGESRHPCFVPDFSEIAFRFTPFNLMFAVGLLYIAFIMFSYVSCIPDLSKTFIMKGCWILLNAGVRSPSVYVLLILVNE